MGDLVHLSDRIGEFGSPSERAALARISSALVQVETEIEALLIGQDKLEAQMGQGADLKQDLAEKIVGEACSIVEMMKKGIAWTLGQTGTRATRKSAELLSVSQLQMAVGEATRAETAQELQRLEARRERLLIARAGLVKETVRESLQPALLEDFANTLELLRDGMVRLAALSRFLSPASDEWRPDASRIAIVLPDFADPDGRRDQTVVATAAAIGQVETILAQFAADLERDPRAPVPELEVDASADVDTPYHALSPAERAQIDRDFAPQPPQHRVTTDSMLFAEQAAAKFAAITN